MTIKGIFLSLRQVSSGMLCGPRERVCAVALRSLTSRVLRIAGFGALRGGRQTWCFWSRWARFSGSASVACGDVGNGWVVVSRCFGRRCVPELLRVGEIVEGVVDGQRQKLPLRCAPNGTSGGHPGAFLEVVSVALTAAGALQLPDGDLMFSFLCADDSFYHFASSSS
ncbi:hypothetical protein C8R45DRAFT_1010525 [Mycena sanguinolenta]|nr:hypothetical protein C8R45DRAFT_1010525 [Mycena sanguinolenta]